MSERHSLQGYRRDVFLIVVIGSTVGLGLISSMLMEPKWMIFGILSLLCIAVLGSVREREKFLVYVVVISAAVSLDFHPIYLETESNPWPVPGFRISLFDVVFFTIFVCWLIKLALIRTVKVRFFPWISIPFLLLCALAMAGHLGTYTPVVIRISTLVMCIESWLIFLYFANHIRDEQAISRVVTALLLSAAIQSILAIGQYTTGQTFGLGIFGESKYLMQMRAGAEIVSRASGTFGHPNNLAGYLSMVVPINVALVFAPGSRTLRARLLLLLLLTVSALILTLSRGGWMAMGLGGGITFFLCLAFKWRHKSAAMLLSLSLLALFFLGSVTLIQPLKQRLLEDDYGAARSRIPMAIVALNIIRHNPWLGVGMTNYISSAPQYDTTLEAISYIFPRPVHNEFLLIAGELGLPALGIFLFILMVLLIRLTRLNRLTRSPPISFLAIGLLGALLSWCIMRQTDYNYVLLADPFWILAGLAQGLMSVSREESLTV